MNQTTLASMPDKRRDRQVVVKLVDCKCGVGD